MFYINERRIDVKRLLKDSGFKPKYNENTGEIYKFTNDTIEFVKSTVNDVWELLYLGGQNQQDIFKLFLVFKAFDGIIDWGDFDENGNETILKQELLIPKNEDYFGKIGD